jgi:hypothetical protein
MGALLGQELAVLAFPSLRANQNRNVSALSAVKFLALNSPEGKDATLTASQGGDRMGHPLLERWQSWKVG